jgi:hypothetical protein
MGLDRRAPDPTALSRLLKTPGRHHHGGGMVMLTAAERHDLIAKMRHLPTAVEAAVKDLGAAQLATPYREGGRTVGQVVPHLADSYLNGEQHLGQVLSVRSRQGW